MQLMIDLILLVLIVMYCWEAYSKRRLWFVVPVYLWMKFAKGRGFLAQLLIFSLPTVSWLLLCHWINTHGWHATAAGGMLIAMTVGLQAMRMAEEEQKWKRDQYDGKFGQ